MHRYIFLLLSAVLLTAGCRGRKKPKFTEVELALMPPAQRQALPAASGGLALSVGGETITADEIIIPLIQNQGPFEPEEDFEEFAARLRPQLENILIGKITNILLYQQAKKQLGKDIEEALNNAVESEVRRFLISFENNYARAEQALKEMDMDWKSFREYQRKMILSQSYVSSKLPPDKPVTYSELLDYYNAIKDEFFITPAKLQFQLIDIEIAKVEPAEADKERSEQAVELADELLERLKAGEDFADLAEQYSHGHRRALGGLWDELNPESLAKPYDILAAEAEKTEPGQITGPIRADGHIFIMKLQQKQAKVIEPFEKVQTEIEARLRFDRRKRAVDEFGAKLIQQATLSEKDRFIDFCLIKIYRIKEQLRLQGSN